MLQLSEACNMLKYVRALTWHLLPGFTWQIPEQFWNRTLKLVKKSLALFARNKRPHDDI